MADEKDVQAGGEAQADATDWRAKYEEMRAHSRDWEKKAKANQSAADELEKLRAEQMSEAEKAAARADAAERELAELKAERERAEKVVGARAQQTRRGPSQCGNAREASRLDAADTQKRFAPGQRMNPPQKVGARSGLQSFRANGHESLVHTQS